MEKYIVKIRGYLSSPSYSFMRLLARFALIRKLVTTSFKLSSKYELVEYLSCCERNIQNSMFKNVDYKKLSIDVDREGVGFGLNLPGEIIDNIMQFSKLNPCFADRKEDCGFYLEDVAIAEKSLSKPILLGQYFNLLQNCPDVKRIEQDPILRWIAASYLGGTPRLVGVNLWWTFPVEATEEDRDLHAHLFHRDIDDYKFLKFFFYITGVEKNDGAHVAVRGSHTNHPVLKISDRWLTRRYSDEEIENFYPSTEILEITGPAGTGFAENTLCIHKGQTPKRNPRLTLHLQYALFDYGVTDDVRADSDLKMLRI